MAGCWDPKVEAYLQWKIFAFKGGFTIKIHNIHINDMKYNSLISAIPKHWKKIVSNTDKVNHMLLDKGESYVFTVGKYLKNVKNKDIYASIIGRLITKPTAENKWIEYYPFLETMNWSNFYVIPKSAFQETKLQTFQYSILHRYLNCNYNLWLWNIKETGSCLFCGELDTIEHRLFLCLESNNLWSRISCTLSYSINFRHEFTILEILLGIPCKKVSLLSLVNYVIVLGKWYIHQSKADDRNVCFLDFL